MAVPRESLGKIPCLCCGEAVPVKKSTGGALSVSCPWCDLSAYAKQGTDAYRRIAGRLPAPAADPAPEPKKAEQAQQSMPTPAPVPPPKKKSASPFPFMGG